MDKLEWVVLFIIGFIFGTMAVGMITDEVESELCNDMGFTYIDKQCLDVKVIKIDETGDSND
ncbi:TMhelix containing protein [Vibrio phage 1.210.O._10N.222.52.C2]|nr:TMhelix containing protein [Vibrio phage 1.210.O._10N.222.52.C2]